MRRLVAISMLAWCAAGCALENEPTSAPLSEEQVPPGCEVICASYDSSECRVICPPPPPDVDAPDDPYGGNGDPIGRPIDGGAFDPPGDPIGQPADAGAFGDPIGQPADGGAFGDPIGQPADAGVHDPYAL